MARPNRPRNFRIGPVTAGQATLLTLSDFTFLGSYDVTAIPNTSQGLTHRYVSGDLRFLSGGNLLREFTLAGKVYGQTISATTRTWASIGGFSVSNDYRGFWWDEPQQRLWSVAATSYTATHIPTQIYTRTLNDDGTISNLRGPLSLQGITAKRVFGNVQPVPASFQSTYGVGPYVVGWGGGTSLILQGGNASIGPTMYAIPEPTLYPSSTTLPAGVFRTIMDYAPANLHRGVRSTLPINYLDGGQIGNPTTPPTSPPLAGATWQSPRSDGLGWWTPCDAHWGTGCWIDTTRKYGFVTVPSLFGGKVYYMNSNVHCDKMQFELHIYDPARFGEVLNGTRAISNVEPTYMQELILAGLSNQGTKSNMTPGKAITGATYDTVTKRLYILGLGINNFSTTNRLYVYAVNA